MAPIVWKNSTTPQIQSNGQVKRITLLCTVHNRRGLCNESELLRILEAISPDAIFEEIHPSDYDSYYLDKSKETLETRTISQYLKGRTIRQIPVDDFAVPSIPLRNDLNILFDYAESNNDVYRALMDERDQKTDQHGFRYLNSLEFEALSKKACESLEKSIAQSGSDSLKKTLSIWNGLLRGREASMLNNIYDFCRKNSFAEGAFLVGAEHLLSVGNEIENRVKSEPDLVGWKIWSRL